VLLNLLTLFFFTTTGNKLFSSGLIYFLAVLGINSDTNRLRTAKNYLYMLAEVVYYMRVLSVEKLLLSACRDKQTNKDRKRFLPERMCSILVGSSGFVSSDKRAIRNEEWDRGSRIEASYSSNSAS
jgi:hypothetical protein